MNALQRLSRAIIKRSFHTAVWTIEKFHDPAPYEQKSRELQAMPARTVGHDIGNCLRANGLRLVPNYESHDLRFSHRRRLHYRGGRAHCPLESGPAFQALRQHTNQLKLFGLMQR